MNTKRSQLGNIKNLRRKYRQGNGVGILLHLVHASNDNVYVAAEDLVSTRKKYHDYKQKLHDITLEVDQLRSQILEKKQNLQTFTTELRKAVAELQSVDLSNLSEQEVQILRLDSWLVKEDVIEAWKHINYAEIDLKDKFQHRKNSLSKKDIRTLNAVSIPNLASSGIVSLNGTVNINRNKCCICLDKRLNAVLYKCGHMCMCFSCASELMKLSEDRKCPVCRTEILDVIKTYLV